MLSLEFGLTPERVVTPAQAFGAFPRVADPVARAVGDEDSAKAQASGSRLPLDRSGAQGRARFEAAAESQHLEPSGIAGGVRVTVSYSGWRVSFCAGTGRPSPTKTENGGPEFYERRRQ